jgi:hypothetical protein
MPCLIKDRKMDGVQKFDRYTLLCFNAHHFPGRFVSMTAKATKNILMRRTDIMNILILGHSTKQKDILTSSKYVHIKSTDVIELSGNKTN